MPNNPAPITDTALAELDRLHASEPVKIKDSVRRRTEFLRSYPAIRARLDRAEADRSAIRAEAFREAAERVVNDPRRWPIVISNRIAHDLESMAAAEEAKANG
jgi:hypothetical protein